MNHGIGALSMTVSSEARTLRHRQAELAARLDRLDRPAPSVRHPRLVRIVDKGDKPSTALAMYAVVHVSVSVDDEEGAEPTLTADASTRSFLAMNIGSGVPPDGTDVIARPYDGLLVFRYDDAS